VSWEGFEFEKGGEVSGTARMADKGVVHD